MYFVLSTCWDNEVSHYLVNVEGGKFGIPGGRIFSNLNQVTIHSYPDRDYCAADV